MVLYLSNFGGEGGRKEEYIYSPQTHATPLRGEEGGERGERGGERGERGEREEDSCVVVDC